MSFKLNAKPIETPLIILILVFILLSCAPHKETGKWESIFNGKDLTGWTIKMAGHPLNENFNNTFQVEDGLLKVVYDQYDEFREEFGHIFYKEKLSNYKVRIEYRFIGNQVNKGPGWAFRNNGIMLHCQSPETMELDQPFPVSVEAQILGGNGQDMRSTANVCTPGTNVVIDGQLITKHCINSSSNTFHGDQWVVMEVEVKGSKSIKNWVNGQLVFELTSPQLDTTDQYAKKLVTDPDNLLIDEGYIALQAESHPIEFRKIELMRLED